MNTTTHHFSPGLRTALSPLLRTNREKQFPDNWTWPAAGRCAGIFLLLGVMGGSRLFAVQLAPGFSDHMVMQAGRPVPVWGSGTAGEQVSVGFAGQTHETTVDAAGCWQVLLDAQSPTPPGVSHTLVVNEVRVEDVLVGAVWLCSGQSNMRYRLGRKPDPAGPAFFAGELARASAPRIRLLNVSGGTPVDRKWAVCSPETAEEFSAIGYFYAKYLTEALDIPVGVVDLGKGGTPIRSFLPRDVYLSIAAANGISVDPNDTQIATVYDKDLTWFAPFAAAGVLWYQGEADASRSATYPPLMTGLVESWRQALQSAELPFLVVQLPVYERSKEASPPTTIGTMWAELREAQAEVARSVPGVHLCVILDLGERLEIHPSRKPEVARRLANLALARVYGQDVVHKGPELRIGQSDSTRAILVFDHVEGGLMAVGSSLEYFTAVTTDGTVVPVVAVITGLNRVEVTLPSGAAVTEIRYGWQNYFVPTFFNGFDLPAAPFRWDLLGSIDLKACNLDTQPASQSVVTGQAVVLRVVASGNPAPVYQWQKDGVAIPGATHASHAIAAAALDDAGSYTVTVANDFGSVTSDPATLTVGTILAAWDIPVSSAVTSVPLASSITGVTGSDLALGSGLGVGANSSSGWRCWSYNQTASDEAAFAAAIAGGNYHEFSITAAAGYQVTVTGIGRLGFFSSTPGPKFIRLIYSTDGWASTQIAGTVNVLSSSGTDPTSAAEAFADFGSGGLVLTAGQTAQFRLVGTGAPAYSGMLGINGEIVNDFTIIGSVSAKHSYETILLIL